MLNRLAQKKAPGCQVAKEDNDTPRKDVYLDYELGSQSGFGCEALSWRISSLKSSETADAAERVDRLHRGRVHDWETT